MTGIKNTLQDNVHKNVVTVEVLGLMKVVDTTEEVLGLMKVVNTAVEVLGLMKVVSTTVAS